MLKRKDNKLDELISLNNVVDQYVVKPSNLQIVLAKISELLRRGKIT